MYHHTIPTFIRLLTNLKGMLKKAEAFAETKKFDVNVLAQSRLAPDMFPFTKQIQIATDTAKGTVARLAGQDPPRYEDSEKTFEELRTRLDKTIDFLKTFKSEQFNGYEDRRVNLPWAPGKYMMGGEYLDQMGIPNVYFHVTMAYAILRHNGVDLGKADFLGDIDVRG